MGTLVVILLSYHSMKLFCLFIIVGGAFAHNDYKEHCKKVKRVLTENVCEPYIEKMCFSKVHQKCHKIALPECKAVIKDDVRPKCVVVEDVSCDLVEKVHIKEVPETMVVQRCLKDEATVCDVVNGLKTVSDQDKDCLNLKKAKCWKEKKVVKEQKCLFSWEFDCPKHMDKHGHKGQKCQKKPVKKCKDIPKVMFEKKCKPMADKVCKKLQMVQPKSVRDKQCHAVPIKKCVEEKIVKPKQVKVFSYKKVCKPVPRKLCGKMLKQFLKPVCKPVEGMRCVYNPERKCHEEKRKHCYKKEKIVYDTVCKKH